MQAMGPVLRKAVKAAAKHGPTAVFWVRSALGDDESQRLVRRGGLRAVARHHAYQHARTLKDGLVGTAYEQGLRYLVVWSGETPVASYPPYSGELEELVRHADRSALQPPPAPTSRLLRRDRQE